MCSFDSFRCIKLKMNIQNLHNLLKWGILMSNNKTDTNLGYDLAAKSLVNSAMAKKSSGVPLDREVRDAFDSHGEAAVNYIPPKQTTINSQRTMRDTEVVRTLTGEAAIGFLGAENLERVDAILDDTEDLKDALIEAGGFLSAKTEPSADAAYSVGYNAMLRHLPGFLELDGVALGDGYDYQSLQDAVERAVEQAGSSFKLKANAKVSQDIKHDAPVFDPKTLG